MIIIEYIDKFKKRFLSGNNLSIKVKKNILYATFLRVFGVLTGFLMIRVTFDFLGNEEIFGIWLTISSILVWINFFDIGLGHGLRNRLTHSLALDEQHIGEIYVSTAYAIISLIALMLIVVYFIVAPFIDWNQVFNTVLIEKYQFRNLLTLLIVFTLLRFLFSLIQSINFAFHDSAIPSLVALISNIMILLILFIFSRLDISGIIILGGLFSIIPVAVLLIASGYFFSTRYKNIKPKFKCINFSYASNLLNLGIKFFIIQIAVVIIFSTDNMIITQILGPEHVTPYQITFKLFSVFTMGATIIMAPLWSAYTDAFARKDFDWIKKVLKKMIFLMIPLIIGVITMVVLAQQIIFFWMGNRVEVPLSLIILMGIFIIISVWSNIFAYLLNGINDINLQLGTAIVAGLVNVPLSIYFAKYLNLGSNGVILGTIISLSIFAVLGPVHIYLIFKKQAT